MGRLDNQVVLVTGGASGLGLAVVERFLAEGAMVGVLDNSERAVAGMTGRVAEAGMADRVAAVVGDVRVLADNQRAVAACTDRFGRLDCAVGNAGIWDFSMALVDLPPDAMDAAFDELFHTNVKGCLHLAKAALQPLTSSRGSIIYTVSNAGFYPAGGGPLYTATKHALVGLIRQLAYELAPYVRVNGVAPGAISTNLRGATALGQADQTVPGDAFAEGVPQITPIGKLPTPEEYAGAYVFFASRADNVPATGTVLNHDGGLGVRGFGAPRGGDDLPERLARQD